MGRKAGVTAESTRADMLAAAARVFALKGYDGASIADITSEANLSSGAIYAHYKSKADLFSAVIDAQIEGEIEALLTSRRMNSVADFLLTVGLLLDTRSRNTSEMSLFVEAIVASKRNPEIRALMKGFSVSREIELASLIRSEQSSRLIDDRVSPAAIARFATFLWLGSILADELGLPSVDEQEWSVLISRLADVLQHDLPG
jgi:AcrR family transcriptional regulator